MGVLSGIVGHELSNIAVPLQSYSDLALESIGDGDPVREYLDEMRIAVGRIKALAHELGSLGEFSSDGSRVAIGECFAAETEDGRPLAWAIDWQSGVDAAAAIHVDRFHARRALEALARIAAEGAPRQTGPVLTVTRRLPDAARCAACLAAFDADRGWLQVRTHTTAIRREELREPLRPAHGDRLFRRLSVAVVVHCAHCAGGHILLDEAAGLLGIVFSPSAPTR